MRARTIREGSVGLLILLGIGLFGGLILWLRGFNPANRPYQITAEFEDTMGVQLGTPVLYRGVPVGRVTSINALSNSVEVGLEITQKDLRIPDEVLVETVESGLIGEISVEITPLAQLAASAVDISPTGPDCDSDVIICDGDRLDGTAGPSYETLLRSAGEVADLLADPELIAQLKDVLTAASTTAEQTGLLATEATELARLARNEITPLSEAAIATTTAATSAAQRVENLANEFTLTASDVNGLIGENRGVLVSTLGNLESASLQLRGAVDVLGPRLQSGELVNDLELVLTNASAASADLQAITSSFNTPANLVLLQQTLESARDALASAQKVMADVDEITGDPAVRNQLRELINGLGGLVSSTQSLEQQSEVARVLTPLEVSPSAIELPSERLTVERLAREQATNGIDGGVDSETENSDRSSNARPVLVFDGERYTIRRTDRLADSQLEPIIEPAKK